MHADLETRRLLDGQSIADLGDDLPYIDRFRFVGSQAACAPAHLVQNRPTAVHFHADQPRVVGQRGRAFCGAGRPLEWQRSRGDAATRVTAYVNGYDLNLFSIVTFFLDDTDRGDQFVEIDGARQSRRRLQDQHAGARGLRDVQSPRREGERHRL